MPSTSSRKAQQDAAGTREQQTRRRRPHPAAATGGRAGGAHGVTVLKDLRTQAVLRDLMFARSIDGASVRRLQASGSAWWARNVEVSQVWRPLRTFLRDPRTQPREEICSELLCYELYASQGWKKGTIKLRRDDTPQTLFRTACLWTNLQSGRQ